MQEALASALDGRNCSALKQCLDTAIAREELPGWKASNPWANRPVKKIVKERDEHSFDLAIWFLFFFIIRHSLGHTLVTIPYDALGQELTSVSEERSRLFAWKSLPNFVGLLSAYVV